VAPSEIPALRADAERNRRRLLDAAAELFTERGLDVTLDEIARHAGVGTGTAYRRFANKDALIDALFEERIDELVALARSCLEVEDPWIALVTYIERALELQGADRGLKQLLHGARGEDRVAASKQRLAPVVGELVQRAVDAGVVRADLELTDVPVINFMLSSVAELARDVEPELWRRYLAIVLDGLRAPGATPLPVRALERDAWQRALAVLNRR
jgi:AcrR family transcriptional regulator